MENEEKIAGAKQLFPVVTVCNSSVDCLFVISQK